MDQTDVYQERFRGRFEAWNVQIDQFLRSLPERRRRSSDVRRLVKQRGRIRARIRDGLSGASQCRQVEREWRELKRTFLERFTPIA